MRDMEGRLATDLALSQRYLAAHEDYLVRRGELGEVPEITGVSAGGMPERVKCLHVLVAHALARGRGVNPLGDEALARLGEWWTPGSCAADTLAAQTHTAHTRHTEQAHTEQADHDG
jgi:hypothetical protein